MIDHGYLGRPGDFKNSMSNKKDQSQIMKKI